MTTTAIRETLHQYIDQSDDKLLKLMLALAKEYHISDDSGESFTAKDIEQFDERKRKWLNGESTAYEWQHAKEIITGKKSF